MTFLDVKYLYNIVNIQWDIIKNGGYMKKKILILSAFALTVGVIILHKNYSKNDVLEDTEAEIVKKENTLSMMLETEAGSGNYEMTTQSNWPTDGYTFNSLLSKCENGGEISWDDTNKKVLMSGNLSDKCYIYFDKYSSCIINGVNYTTTASSVTLKANVTEGSHQITKYYFSIDDGNTYVETDKNTYTFTGLLTNKSYNVKVKVKDSLGKESSTFSIAIKIILLLKDYIINLYNGVQGSNNIYYHNGTLVNGINDGSYRYAGASENVKNYICLGSKTSSCPDANLFRIIGIIDGKVKVIRAKSVTNMAWTDNKSNVWSTSSINSYLNEIYTNSLGNLINIIDTTVWKVGGNTRELMRTVVPSVTYENEIINPVDLATYSSKIGLLYASDYGFAALPSAWTTTLYAYYTADSSGTQIRTIDWLYLGSNELLISRITNYTDQVYYISSQGGLAYEGVGVPGAVRPTFSLSSTVSYVSGSGSVSDPIIIE